MSFLVEGLHVPESNFLQLCVVQKKMSVRCKWCIIWARPPELLLCLFLRHLSCHQFLREGLEIHQLQTCISELCPLSHTGAGENQFSKLLSDLHMCTLAKYLHFGKALTHTHTHTGDGEPLKRKLLLQHCIFLRLLTLPFVIFLNSVITGCVNGRA